MEQTQNKAKYGAERSFQHGWKSGRAWLAFEDGQMTSDMHSLSCVTYCRYDFVKQYRFGSKYYVIVVIVCHQSKDHFVHRLSIRPSLRHALLLLTPQRDKWHLNNNNIEFYWNHFVHSSLNNKCIYLDLKWLYDQNYMLYEKKVRSDKILFGLTKSRILSGQCLTKLWSISTALLLDQSQSWFVPKYTYI